MRIIHFKKTSLEKRACAFVKITRNSLFKIEFSYLIDTALVFIFLPVQMRIVSKFPSVNAHVFRVRFK